MSDERTWIVKIEHRLGIAFRVIVVAIALLSIYLFMQVHNQAQTAKVAATTAVHKAQVAQEKSGVRTCIALVQLAHASDGIDLSGPSTPDKLYLQRLNKALINVVDNTGCNRVVKS